MNNDVKTQKVQPWDNEFSRAEGPSRNQISALAPGLDGSVLIGAQSIMRVLSSGVRDPDFSPPTFSDFNFDSIAAIAADGDAFYGAICAVEAKGEGTRPRYFPVVGRFLPNGKLDKGFGDQGVLNLYESYGFGNGCVTYLKVDSDSSFILGREEKKYQSVWAKYDTSGKFLENVSQPEDATSPMDLYTRFNLKLTDGRTLKIEVTEPLDYSRVTPRIIKMSQRTSNGEPDGSFGAQGTFEFTSDNLVSISAATLLTDGTIVIAGDVDSDGQYRVGCSPGFTKPALFRFNANGSPK